MDEQQGAMIALFVPLPTAQMLTQLTSGAGLTPQDAAGLHLTLCCFDASQFIPAAPEALLPALRTYAATHGPVIGQISGIGRFTNGDGDANALYASFDGEALAQMRTELTDTLGKIGMQIDGTHGFTPHITLAYIAPDAPMPDISLAPMDVVFDAITLAVGDERYSFEFFTGDVALKAEDDPADDDKPADPPPEPDPAPDDGEPMKAIPRNVVRPISTTVKSVEGSDGWDIEGYGVVFNWRDASPNREFFTKNTDFMWDEFPLTWARPELFDHGQDGTVKHVGVGFADKIEIDDVGIWVQGHINRRSRYAQHVKRLLDEGALGWSSGSVAHLAKRSRTVKGQIDVWPIVEFSLTPVPAMPEGTEISAAKAVWSPADIEFAYKSLNLPIPPALDALAQEDASKSDKEIATGVHAPTATKAAVIRIKANPQPTIAVKPKDTKMTTEVTLEQVTEKVTAGVAAALGPHFEAFTKALADLKPTPDTTKNGTTKSLPAPKAGDNPSTTKNNQRIVLGEDRRYADLSSADIAFLTEAFSAVAAGAKFMQWARAGELKPLQQTALKFMERFNDEDKKFERMICAKAIREANRKEISGDVIEYLPYKSLEDVYANDYDDSALKAAREEFAAAVKANELDNTAQSNYGAEYVPTLWGKDWWRRVRQANAVAQNMQRFELPSGTFNWPLESTDPTVFFVAEGTDATQLVLTNSNTMTLSKVGSDKRQFVAKKIGARIAWSTELNEESVIPIASAYRAQLERAMLNAIDSIIVNGDTATGANTNINLIDGTPTTGVNYLALDGLRKYSLVTNTGQKIDFAGASPTLALFRAMRGKLNREYMADIGNLVYIVPPEVYMVMLNMPEFSNWINLGMPGANATGLLPYGSPEQTGDVARPVGQIDGIPVYLSAQIGLAKVDGNISGTGSNNIYGSSILYHRSRWWMGNRRNITINLLTPDVSGIFSDTMQLWSTARFDVKNFDTQSAVNGIGIKVA